MNGQKRAAGEYESEQTAKKKWKKVVDSRGSRTEKKTRKPQSRNLKHIA
jgi:hypothetical protein